LRRLHERARPCPHRGGAGPFDLPERRARIGSRIGEWARLTDRPCRNRWRSAHRDWHAGIVPQNFFSATCGNCAAACRAMSFGSVMHNTIKYFIGELPRAHASVRGVARKFELEWTSAGFEMIQEQEYKKDGLAQCELSTPVRSPHRQCNRAGENFQPAMDNNVVLTGRMDR